MSNEGAAAADQAFRELIRRVRAGDQQAAAELVKQYEPEIRRAVRLHLNDPRLGRVLDSLDVCQSVMGRFFALVAADRVRLDNPAELLGLLVTMARNKLRDQVRYHYAACRDARLADGGAETLAHVPGREATPSGIVADDEVLQAVRARLTEEERDLADQRALGREWADIAAERGEKADAVRRRLSRALDRAFQELGLGDARTV